jgi:hypothetical protein
MIKKTWLSALSYAQSSILLVSASPLVFLFLGFLPLTAKSDLADFVSYVWRQDVGTLFVCLQKLYLSYLFVHVFFALFNFNKTEVKSKSQFGPYFPC